MNIKERTLIRREKHYDIWRETSVINFSAEAISTGHGTLEDEQALDDLVEMIKASKGQEITLEIAYTKAGDYIGDEKTAKYLCDELGIAPEIAGIKRDLHQPCSIGFCEKKGKWYGWSHRAIFGFGIGDTVKEGDCCAVSGWTEDYLLEHPEEDLSLPVGFEAKTIEDAKRMAIAFAESVG